MIRKPLPVRRRAAEPSVLRRDARRGGCLPSMRSTALCALCWMVLATARSTGAEYRRPAAATGSQPYFATAGQPTPMTTTARRSICPLSDSRLVDDVVLHADGLLLGQVIAVGSRQTARGVGPVRIELFQHRARVATAVADRHGSFAIGGLAGGFYQLAVSGRSGTVRKLVRLWTPTAAPPHAQVVTTVRMSEASGGDGGRSSTASMFPGICRAQGPASRRAVWSAVTTTAIAAGAIAAPVIYKDLKRDSFIPATQESPASP